MWPMLALAAGMSAMGGVRNAVRARAAKSRNIALAGASRWSPWLEAGQQQAISVREDVPSILDGVIQGGMAGAAMGQKLGAGGAPTAALTDAGPAMVEANSMGADMNFQNALKGAETMSTAKVTPDILDYSLQNETRMPSWMAGPTEQIASQAEKDDALSVLGQLKKNRTLGEYQRSPFSAWNGMGR